MAISKDTLDTIRISELPQATGHADGDLLVVTGGEDFVTRKETVRNFTRNNVTLDGDQTITGRKTFWPGGVELGKNATMTCELPGNCPDASVVNAGFVRDNFAKKEHTHTRDEITDLNGLDDVYSRLDHKHQLQDINDIDKLNLVYSKLDHKHKAEDITDLGEFGDGRYSKLDHKHKAEDITDLGEFGDGRYSKLDHKHKAEDITGLTQKIKDDTSSLYAPKEHNHDSRYVRVAKDLSKLTDKVGSEDVVYINHNGVDMKMDLAKIIYEPPEGVTSLNVYVSTNGNDEEASKHITSGGTQGEIDRKNNPYRTLQKAIDDMSKVRSSSSGFTFQINVLPGTYEINQEIYIRHPDCTRQSDNVLAIKGPPVDVRNGEEPKVIFDFKNFVCRKEKVDEKGNILYEYLDSSKTPSEDEIIQYHRKYESYNVITSSCYALIDSIKFTNSLCGNIPYNMYDEHDKDDKLKWLRNTYCGVFWARYDIILSQCIFSNATRNSIEGCVATVENCKFYNMTTAIEVTQGGRTTLFRHIYFDVYYLFGGTSSEIHCSIHKTAKTFFQGIIRSDGACFYLNGSIMFFYIQIDEEHLTQESVLQDPKYFQFNVQSRWKGQNTSYTNMDGKKAVRFENKIINIDNKRTTVQNGETQFIDEKILSTYFSFKKWNDNFVWDTPIGNI